MLYLDTSVLVSAYTNEVRSKSVREWLESQNQMSLTISDWVVTEFSSALSIKTRTAQITPLYRSEALALFIRIASRSFTIVPASRTQFHIAARFADQYALGLRAGDALHLAIAADQGATLCTLDHRLAEAGQKLGVATLRV